jgi:hypothetical protein
MRTLVLGVGINDADYITNIIINGKMIMCPYYIKWVNILVRCYSTPLHKKYPTYKGCTICDKWLTFSNFRVWMVEQNWQGLELDKDIKIKGNKVYSPDACLFVPRALNGLLNNSAKSRGRHPVGVCFYRRSGKFQANISYNGKRTHLGRFSTPSEASERYQQARKEKIQRLVADNTYPMATQYLEQHI